MIRRFLTLGSGEALSRVLFLLAFIAIARGLGKVALGQFGLALSLTSYLVLAVQQGFDQIAMRSVARDPTLLGTYVRGLLGLRLLITTALYSLLLVYARWRAVPQPENVLLLILGLTCFTTALAPRWAFQVLSPSQFAISGILSQLVFCLGALAVFSGKGIYWAAVSYLIGDAVSAAYLLRAIQRVSAASPSWTPPFWLSIIKESWPLSLSALLGILVYNFDILALGWLATPADLGLYLACYRCATVFAPLLSILQVSILPSYANAYPDRKLLRKGIWTVAIPSAIVAGFVAAVLTAFPQELLRLIYGSGYAGGAAVLRVLAWSLPVQAVRSILRQTLLAAHLQRLDTVNMSFAAATSILIDLILIPRLGPVACAISTISSEVVLLISSAAVLKLKVFRHTLELGV